MRKKEKEEEREEEEESIKQNSRTSFQKEIQMAKEPIGSKPIIKNKPVKTEITSAIYQIGKML